MHMVHGICDGKGWRHHGGNALFQQAGGGPLGKPGGKDGVAAYGQMGAVLLGGAGGQQDDGVFFRQFCKLGRGEIVPTNGLFHIHIPPNDL